MIAPSAQKSSCFFYSLQKPLYSGAPLNVQSMCKSRTIHIFSFIGTRESKANSTSPNAVAWYRIAWGKLKTFCGMCCQRKFYDDPQRSEIMLAESDLVSESCDLASDVDLRVSHQILLHRYQNLIC